MSRSQLTLISLAAVLFLGLYLGVPTKPKERAAIEKDRIRKASEITPEKLLLRAREIYAPEEIRSIIELERSLDSSSSETEQIETLKRISSEWNKLGDFALGGAYAEEVASIENKDSSWAIAGSTFFSGFRFEHDSTVSMYCLDKAISSFENAISLNPDESRHKVNLGLCYVEGGKQPMRGIVMIRDILEKEPENVLVLYTLGRLSVQSGQTEKAIERLSAVVRLDPEHLNGRYLLAQSLMMAGRKEEARMNFEEALKLASNENVKKDIKNILKDF